MKVRELIKSDRDKVISVINDGGVFAAEIASNADAVIYIPSDMSITTVTQVMAGNKIGFSIIVDELGKLAGVLSERDIIVALGKKGRLASDVKVSDIMTKNVTTCSPDDDIINAIEIMGSLSIRHLVVVENTNVIGVLSSRDIFAMMAKKITEHGLSINDQTNKNLNENSIISEEMDEFATLNSFRR